MSQSPLVAPYLPDIHKRVASSFSHAKEIYGAKHIAVVSNSLGSRRFSASPQQNETGEADEIAAFERSSGVKLIIHNSKKPSKQCFDAVRNHFCALSKQTNDSTHFEELIRGDQILVVGDRLLTDIVFGNLFDCKTLHCRGILSSEGENLPTKMSRQLEGALLFVLSLVRSQS